jgi:hypothetical protein
LPLSVILIVFARIVMIEDILPLKALKERYHSWKTWPEEMKKTTKGLPVVFDNFYQYASKYWFYTGQVSYAQSNYKVRKNNFYFWPVEDSLLGKPVFVFNKHEHHLFSDFFETPFGKIGYKYDPAFASFSKLRFNTVQKDFRIGKNDSLVLNYSVAIPQKFSDHIRYNPLPPDTIKIGVFNKNGWVKDIHTNLKLKNLVVDRTDTLVTRPMLEPGKYILKIAIQVNNYYPSHNSDNIKLEVY